MGQSLKKLFDFRGTTGRREFWLTLLVILSVYLIAPVFAALIGFSAYAFNQSLLAAVFLVPLGLLAILLNVGAVIALVALVVRRLRDTKISKIIFIGSMILTPALTTAIIRSLPSTLIETIRVYGKEHVYVASVLSLVITFALPFIVVGMFPSKEE